MTKIKDLDPDFIKELLKAKGIDLDKLDEDPFIGGTGVNQRIQLMGASMKLMEAWDKFELELLTIKNRFHGELIDILSLVYDAIVELSDKDNPNISDDMAHSVKKVLEKFQEEIKENKN